MGKGTAAFEGWVLDRLRSHKAIRVRTVRVLPENGLLVEKAVSENDTLYEDSWFRMTVFANLFFVKKKLN